MTNRHEVHRSESGGKITITRKLSRKERAAGFINRHWFVLFMAVYGIFITLPLLAPVFMRLGLENAGRAIYAIYANLCHQLPQRSWFLFGEQASYSLEAIQGAWQQTIDPEVLRQFIGNTRMGWKVAWSDRMVSLYGGIFLAALVWYPLRNKVRKIPLWLLTILLVPMIVDGTTHMISDFSGIGNGFRDHNQWLAALSTNAYPPEFYAGDMLGSFNSWARLISGVMFAFGIVFFAFPQIDNSFKGYQKMIEFKQTPIEFSISSAQAPKSGENLDESV